MADVKSGDTVVPGDQLCVIEELSPSFGTYEKEGIVYAATAGSVSMDLSERSISVRDSKGKTKLPLPVSGDIIIAEIISGYEKRTIVSILKINGVHSFNGLEGEVLIGDVTRRYVNSMHDVMKAGDIIRGVALNTHVSPTKIGLVGFDFGVILAKCVKCGNELTLTTHNNMICLRCENRETREVAKDYGTQFGIESRPDLAPRRRSYGDRRDDDRRGGDRRGGRRDDRRRDSRRR